MLVRLDDRFVDGESSRGQRRAAFVLRRDVRYPSAAFRHGQGIDGIGRARELRCPIITETDLFKEMAPAHIAAMKAKIPMGRFLTIPEIAAMVAWIASPERSFTTGATFDLFDGCATD